MKPTQKNIEYMLTESNLIEGVDDRRSVLDAKKAWKFIMQFDTINSQIVRETHKILMKNQDIPFKYKGAYRDVPIYIGGKRKFDSPLVLHEKIRDWCSKTNFCDRNDDPVSLHIEFEEVHPFLDGNGRIGRILLNWHLLKITKANWILVYTHTDRPTYYRLFQDYRSREWFNMYKVILNMTGEKNLWDQ